MLRRGQGCGAGTQNALVGAFVGERMTSPADVADALVDIYGFPEEVFSVHRHGSGTVLVYFAAQEDRDHVLADEFIQSPYFRLQMKPWSRRTNTTAGGLGVHVSLEIKGVPANAWSLVAAETMLAPNSWVEHLDPFDSIACRHGDVRLMAWCLDPSLVSKELNFHMVESGER